MLASILPSCRYLKILLVFAQDVLARKSKDASQCVRELVFIPLNVRFFYSRVQ